MRQRGVDVSDVERIAGGKTFFWRGEYGWDLNSRETLDTQLGVFEGFQPKLSEASRSSDVLFLANIQPDLQREVRAQLPDARFVALDSMNLWIDIARDSLVSAIENVDCLILNDAELRQLTGKSSLTPRPVMLGVLSWGPRPSDRRQAGRVWRRAGHAGRLLSPARVPTRDRGDPTGPATRSRAASWHIAAHSHMDLSELGLLRQAMAYGTALASFNVEEFGTERVQRLTGEESGSRGSAAAARDDAVRGRLPRRCRDLRLSTWYAAVRVVRTDGGYTIEGRGRVDLPLADGLPEDPDRRALPARALGGAPDARSLRWAPTAASARAYRPHQPHHPRTRPPRLPRRGPHGDARRQRRPRAHAREPTARHVR